MRRGHGFSSACAPPSSLETARPSRPWLKSCRQGWLKKARRSGGLDMSSGCRDGQARDGRGHRRAAQPRPILTWLTG